MLHTGWWPDYNIRFFRKGTVSWSEIIHSVPTTTGQGYDVPAEKEMAIIHNSYSSVEEYLLRMNRYTTVQAKELNKNGMDFNWRLLISKPFSQFLTRYFAQEGFKDGIHGLALSLLQAFSELILYIKLWQKNNFSKKKVSLESINQEINEAGTQIMWWLYQTKMTQEKNMFKKIWLKLTRKITG